MERQILGAFSNRVSEPEPCMSQLAKKSQDMWECGEKEGQTCGVGRRKSQGSEMV